MTGWDDSIPLISDPLFPKSIASEPVKPSVDCIYFQYATKINLEFLTATAHALLMTTLLLLFKLWI